MLRTRGTWLGSGCHCELPLLKRGRRGGLSLRTGPGCCRRNGCDGRGWNWRGGRILFRRVKCRPGQRGWRRRYRRIRGSIGYGFVVVVPAENAGKVSRCSGDRNIARHRALVGRDDAQDDAIAFGRDGVKVNLVKIHHDSSDQRQGAMLAGSHLANTIVVDRNCLRRRPRNRVGKIQQDPVRLHGCIHRGRHRSAESDFHAHIGAFAGDRNILHASRREGPVLCRCTGCEDQYCPKMFLNYHHSQLALSDAPLCRLQFVSCNCKATRPRICCYPPWPLRWHW